MSTVKSLVYAVVVAFVMFCGSVLAVMPPVGEVTLTIGQATLYSLEGGEHKIVRGTSVRPGDLIQTEAGGHVHVRFTDGALVSVRPFSRLVVEEYIYNPTQADLSKVRFRLEAGTARAISGSAAEHARERFRLNTPLVAIGVRGTDFTVLTSDSLTMASVSQGAIVMAPLSDDCPSSSLGPCDTQQSRLLSAEMEGVFAEFRSDLEQPELRAQLINRPLAAVAVAPQGSTASVPETDVDAADTILTTTLRQQLAVQTQIADTPGTENRSVNLVWGRWGEPMIGGDISVPRDVARANGDPVVFGWPYTLYRLQSEGMAWPQALGRASFALQAASAQWQNAGVTSAAAVTGGQLVIDFANFLYSTQLQLEGVPFLLSTLHSSGRIGADGVFSSRSSGQSVTGAVAFDGFSAGYMFQKAGQGGIVSGITLWSR